MAEKDRAAIREEGKRFGEECIAPLLAYPGITDEYKELLNHALSNFIDDYERYYWVDYDKSLDHLNSALCAIRCELALLNAGLSFKPISGGFVINGKFCYYYVSGKWRVVGRNKYYRSQSIESAIEKYFKRG